MHLNTWRLRRHKEFDESFASTHLPERLDYAWANEFLLKARREMAKMNNDRTSACESVVDRRIVFGQPDYE